MKIKHTNASTAFGGGNTNASLSTASTSLSAANANFNSTSSVFNANPTFNFNINGPSSVASVNYVNLNSNGNGSFNINNNEVTVGGGGGDSAQSSFIVESTSQHPRSTSTASMLARINEESLSPSFGTQIQTRAAASRAAAAQSQHQQQQQKQHFNSVNKMSTSDLIMSSSSSFKRHSSHNHHHHQNQQHAIGKIVKPIPVRPMSSSSSSSTHSSSFSTAANLIIKGNHHHYHHHHNQNVTQSVENNSISTHSDNLNESSSSLQSGNFSLIAKYFASFPATRLKAQSPNVEQMSNGNGIDLRVMGVTANTLSSSNALLFKPSMLETSTPFLPFKKAQTSHNHKANTFSPFSQNTNNAHSSSFVTQNSATGPAESASSAQQETSGIQFNLRSSTSHNNTDHLCTNFKRMIKLNDNSNHVIASAIVEDAASPRTAASNTPTGLLDSDSCGGGGEHASSSLSNHSNGDVQQSNANYNCLTSSSSLAQVANNNNFTFSNLLNENLTTAVATTSSTAPIFGQITMETRSTRKFLIKHHPYLQMNNTNNFNSSPQQQHFGQLEANRSNSSTNNKQQSRPSINLIKMKRMIYANNSNESSQRNAAHASPTLNRNYRTCKASQETWDGHDQKLVKFTDIAPSPGYSSTSQRIKNQLLLASTKRRQSATSTVLATAATSSPSSVSIANDSVLTRSVNNTLDANAYFSTNVTAPHTTNLNKTPQGGYALKTRKSSTSSNSASFAAPTTPCTPYQLKHLSHTMNSNSNNITSNANSNTQLLGKSENEWSYFLNSSGGYDNGNSFSHEDLCWEEDETGEQPCEDDIDDSQEDSSGYYSSYHSVDLISSSGGSSGGDLTKHQHSSKTVNLNMFGVKHNAIDKDIITPTTVVGVVDGDDINNQVKSSNQMPPPPPHHHYHTRYLSNILQQSHHSQAHVSNNNTDLTSHRNSSTTPTVKQNQNISHQAHNNTPTTRLRYQQQLAAAAASANLLKSHSLLTPKQQHQLEIDSACDLDLDQIEND